MIDQEVTQAIEWVYKSYGKVPMEAKQGFDRDVRHPEWTRRLLDTLGSPDVGTYNIAVTGSKGKGTHAILLAAILQQLGLRVGLFTSPHLVDFLERIRLDGQQIDPYTFVRLCQQVRDVASSIEIPKSQYFGPVGLLATVASLWFREQETDVNVYELGRGAKHDDVNQILHQGALLAPVFTEHADKLGPTFEHIIEEKLGVATKDTRWLVTHEQVAECERAVMDLRDATSGDIEMLNRQFTFELVPAHDGQCLVTTMWKNYKISALVSREVSQYASNVAVALQAAARVLDDVQPSGMGNDVIVDISNLNLPARLQVVQQANGPTCFIDGTIHRHSARYVAQWIRRSGPYREVWVLFSLPDDKDGIGVIEEIAPLASHVWFTRSANRHLIYSKDWTQEAKKFASDVGEARTVETAITELFQLAHKDDVILFLGTQSYVGEVLRSLGVQAGSIWDDRR